MAWPQPYYDARNSSARPEIRLPESLALDWEQATGTVLAHPPVVHDGHVYVTTIDRSADREYELLALDAADGSTVWSTAAAESTSPPVVHGDRIAVRIGQFLHLLEPATGVVDWRRQLRAADGGVRSHGDHLLVGGPVAQCVDPAADVELWHEQLPALDDEGSLGIGLAVVDSGVYVGHGDAVFALDRDTGDRRWRFEAGEAVRFPVVGDETVYVGGFHGNVHALDAETGAQRWTFETNSWVEESVTVAEGTVFVGCTDDHLYVLDAATGDHRWHVAADSDVDTSPAVAAETVVAATVDGGLVGVDRSTGETRWRVERGSAVVSPAIADGTVYAADQGSVFRLG